MHVVIFIDLLWCGVPLSFLNTLEWFVFHDTIMHEPVVRAFLPSLSSLSLLLSLSPPPWLFCPIITENYSQFLSLSSWYDFCFLPLFFFFALLIPFFKKVFEVIKLSTFGLDVLGASFLFYFIILGLIRKTPYSCIVRRIMKSYCFLQVLTKPPPPPKKGHKCTTCTSCDVKLYFYVKLFIMLCVMF